MNLMRGGSVRRKGEPVWVLVAILGGWVGVRAATWDGAADGAADGPAHAVGAELIGDPGFVRGAAKPAAAVGLPAARPAMVVPGMLHGPVAGVRTIEALGEQDLLWLAAVANMPLAFDGARRGAGAHAIMFAKASSASPVPGRIEIAPASDLAPPRAAPGIERPSAPGGGRPVLPRWSGDAWALLRDGGGAAPGGSLLLPSYGANQVGAVLRYRLAPASGYKPTVYARAYAALNGTGEREVAAGLSARPLPAVPLVVMGEGRISRFDNGTNHLRPAVTLVTELPPAILPGAMRAETYVQGGYVGGLGATPFIDGQFRLEHIAEHQGRSELRLGGGVWGGAQKGAARLDVGPTATVAFATARAGAHLSVDWRLRVAGHALPGSGPAVTLAAGF